MKSIAKFFVIGILLLAGFGYASAQSAASNSREITPAVPATSSPQTVAPVAPAQIEDTLPDRGIPTPPIVEKLLQEGKFEQAINEFEKFKAGLKKANPFQIRFLEMTIYEQALDVNPNNSKYIAKRNALKQELIEKFPNEPDAYLLQIDNSTPADVIVELTTKALNADPQYTEAYSQRGRALYKLGQTKEACADFEKVPWREMLPEFQPCKDL